MLSTLSMPIHVDGEVVGGVNLYGATPNGFAGKESRLAAILGAWAPGAVRNATCRSPQGRRPAAPRTCSKSWRS